MKTKRMILLILLLCTVLLGCNQIEKLLDSFTEINESQTKSHINEGRGLEKKIEELSNLSESLINKRREISQVQVNYKNEIVELKTEIAYLQTTDKLADFESAIKKPRIKNNLTLIQKKLAYLDRLNLIVGRLMRGSEELIYLKRDAETDLSLIDVLNDEEIKALADEIDAVINEYLPDAGRLIFEDKNLALRPINEIWQEIFFTQASETLKTTEYQLSQPSILLQQIDEEDLISQIAKGIINMNWYRSTDKNIFGATITESHTSDLYTVGIDKIICIHPFTIIGLSFTCNSHNYDKIIELYYEVDCSGSACKYGKPALNDKSWISCYVPQTRKTYMSSMPENSTYLNASIPLKREESSIVVLIFPYQKPEHLIGQINYIHFASGEMIEFLIK